MSWISRVYWKIFFNVFFCNYGIPVRQLWKCLGKFIFPPPKKFPKYFPSPFGPLSTTIFSMQNLFITIFRTCDDYLILCTLKVTSSCIIKLVFIIWCLQFLLYSFIRRRNIYFSHVTIFPIKFIHTYRVIQLKNVMSK